MPYTMYIILIFDETFLNIHLELLGGGLIAIHSIFIHLIRTRHRQDNSKLKSSYFSVIV